MTIGNRVRRALVVFPSLSLSLFLTLSLFLYPLERSFSLRSFSPFAFHLLVFRVRFRAMAFTRVFRPVSSLLTTFFSVDPERRIVRRASHVSPVCGTA